MIFLYDFLGLIKLKQKYAKQGNIAKLANTLKDIGDIYYENGHFDDALQEYSEQLDLCTNLDDKLNSSIAHRMIGECHINIGNFSEASRHLNKHLGKQKQRKCTNKLLSKMHILCHVFMTFLNKFSCKQKDIFKYKNNESNF